MLIEKNIPIPPIKRGKPSMYGFRDMQVGDSIFLAGSDGRKAAIAAKVFAHRNEEYAFRSRNVVENGIRGRRIWRVDA